MNDLDEQITWLESTLNECSKKLSGDLFNDQIEIYDLAFSRAELLAAKVMRRKAASNPLIEAMSNFFSLEIISNIAERIQRNNAHYQVDLNPLLDFKNNSIYLSSGYLKELGELIIQQGLPLEDFDEEKSLMRDTFRNFAEDIVKPLAEKIHRENLLVPDSILEPLRELGCFGLSVPISFGGLTPDEQDDSLGMVVATEELSRGSLGAAGSLITRPEIMARAILEGGTQEQKERWLPNIAKGEPLCAVSVTEPNTGSDVASVALKATKTSGGWLLNGGKTWCTFAGAAGILSLIHI